MFSSLNNSICWVGITQILKHPGHCQVQSFLFFVKAVEPWHYLIYYFQILVHTLDLKAILGFDLHPFCMKIFTNVMAYIFRCKRFLGKSRLACYQNLFLKYHIFPWNFSLRWKNAGKVKTYMPTFIFGKQTCKCFRYLGPFHTMSYFLSCSKHCARYLEKQDK